jgi:hypothetical protein
MAESMSLELGTKAFKAFNHSQFYGPVSVDGQVDDVQLFGETVSAALPCLVQPVRKIHVLVRMRGVPEAGAGVGHDELAQFDPAQSKHAVCHRLEVFASAIHDDYLKAVMMIEVDVRCRQDHGTGMVLDFS